MLSFNNFLLERFNINNLPSNIILLSSDLNKDGGVFLLYYKDNKTPIGYISFGLYPGIESFTTGGCYSENGYGAFLYESVMTYISIFTIYNTFMIVRNVNHEQLCHERNNG